MIKNKKNSLVRLGKAYHCSTAHINGTHIYLKYLPYTILKFRTLCKTEILVVHLMDGNLQACF